MNPGRLTRLGLTIWLVLGAAHQVGANGLVVQNPGAEFRLERVAVPGGAQLITLFGRRASPAADITPPSEVPILSVLRDTLGDTDPANDRFRQVWVYSYAKPSVWQKFTASLPFFYHSTIKSHQPGDGAPSPLLDLGNPRKGTWRNLTEALLQVEVLDGIGVPFRLASRSYRENSWNYRNVHLWQASTALSIAESSVGQDPLRGEVEFPVLGARLSLATRPLGGLVSDSYLRVAWENQNHQSSVNRGHNWELLRQKAEENALRFEPLSLAGQKNNFALLWKEQLPAGAASPQQFSKQFLGISNPFKSKRNREQGLFTQTWHLDSQGDRVPEDTPGARAATMQPLALYSLDHPRVPLLLVDFRNPHRPGTGERVRRFATDFTVNVLGLAALGDWQFMLAKSSFMFIRRRHGAPLDRSARMRSYAQLRYSLKFDNSLDPYLRQELERNLQGLGLNPMSVSISGEVDAARAQHAALLTSAESPAGLALQVRKNRARELVAARHSRGIRVFLGLAHIGTLGLYSHGEDLKQEGLQALDLQRRFAYEKRFLEGVLRLGPQPEIAWNSEVVGRSIDTVSELGQQGQKVRSHAVKLLWILMRETGDDAIRRQCVVGLQRLGTTPPVHLASLHAPTTTGTEPGITEGEGLLAGSK